MLTVPLAFLGGGRWTAEIWQDGQAPTKLVKTERVVGPGDRLTLKLAPSGGAAVRLRPVR